MAENAVDMDIESLLIETAQVNFTQEYAVELIRAGQLLMSLEYPEFDLSLTTILFSPDFEDQEVRNEAFSDYLTTSVKDVLSKQGIEVSTECRLSDTCDIVTSITMLNYIEDKIPLARILETDFSNEEKLAKLLRTFSLKEEIYFLNLLDFVSDEFLDMLAEVLNDEVEIDDNPLTIEERTELRQQFLLFLQFTQKDQIAKDLVEQGFPIGMPMSLYLTFVSEHLVSTENIEDFATDLLGLFYLASDTYRNPLAAYRESSEVLVIKPENLTKVEMALRKLIETFDQYKRENP